MHKIIGWGLFFLIIAVGLSLVVRFLLVEALVSQDMTGILSVPKKMGIKPVNLDFVELQNPPSLKN